MTPGTRVRFINDTGTVREVIDFGPCRMVRVKFDRPRHDGTAWEDWVWGGYLSPIEANDNGCDPWPCDVEV